VLEGVVSRLAEVEAFRKGFPAGFVSDPEAAARAADELVEVAVAWLRAHGADAVARLAVEGFVSSRPPGYAGCGTFACNLASFDVRDELVVKLRDGLCALLDEPPDPPALRWSDRVWSLDADQAAAVAALGDRPGGARVGELDCWLDRPARAAFVRDLLREGIVEPVP
jgi:hypothetical protein